MLRPPRRRGSVQATKQKELERRELGLFFLRLVWERGEGFPLFISRFFLVFDISVFWI